MCADELEEGECEVERAEKAERRRVNMEHLSQNIHESVDVARTEADGGERGGEKESMLGGWVMVMMVIMVMVLKVGLGDDECLHF